MCLNTYQLFMDIIRAKTYYPSYILLSNNHHGKGENSHYQKIKKRIIKCSLNYKANNNAASASYGIHGTDLIKF